MCYLRHAKRATVLLDQDSNLWLLSYVKFDTSGVFTCNCDVEMHKLNTEFVSIVCL